MAYEADISGECINQLLFWTDFLFFHILSNSQTYIIWLERWPNTSLIWSNVSETTSLSLSQVSMYCVSYHNIAFFFLLLALLNILCVIIKQELFFSTNMPEAMLNDYCLSSHSFGRSVIGSHSESVCLPLLSATGSNASSLAFLWASKISLRCSRFQTFLGFLLCVLSPSEFYSTINFLLP